MSNALISNIQRFSLDDGPGIRTTVFFKGCSLACAWCHNPECIPAAPVLQYSPGLCGGCGGCVSACQSSAHTMGQSGHAFDRALCSGCGRCATVCRKKALKLVGTAYGPGELMEELLKDRHYYRNSGGGVTFSGGEPALFPGYIAEVAALCRAEGIPVALDTAGHVPFGNYETLLPFVDLFLYDIKCFDDHLHRRWTGASNQGILENLRRLDGAGAAFTIRVPVVPGFNTAPEEHGAIAAFLASLEGTGLIELLPYHSYGAGKYETLGMENAMGGHSPPTEEEMALALAQYTAAGLDARLP